MPAPSPDTSFLFSLYGDDAHTTRARGWLSTHGGTLPVTTLALFEHANALRCAAFRKAITHEDALSALQAVAHDLKSGMLVIAGPSLPDVLTEAERLSARHSLVGGFRSFDILHVATARVLKADVFLSFDVAQRNLAAAAGLKVGP